jgi:8-hydroxy-5-deazaflavin:NADPH oxidoreductase
MRYGVLGTGTVGQAFAAALRDRGHEVLVGSRTAGDGTVTFAEAASSGEVLVNATAGAHSLDALALAGADALAGKVLVDVANPIGVPPSGESLAERIQRAFPEARVVKALNTVNASVMVDPAQIPGEHHAFICGDDAAAKDAVRSLLGAFGWPAASVLDLGGIEAARGTEAYLAFWIRLWQALGTATFNVAVRTA